MTYHYIQYVTSYWTCKLDMHNHLNALYAPHAEVIERTPTLIILEGFVVSLDAMISKTSKLSIREEDIFVAHHVA